MLSVHPIQSLDLPELQPYRTMRRQFEQREQGIFVAEGEKVVRRLLESDLAVVSLLVPEKWLRELEQTIAARPESIKVFVAEKSLLETLTGFSMYQGLLAVARVPARRTVGDVLKDAAKPVLLTAVEGLSSAENVGVLVRNCAAFSVAGLLVGETSSSPYLRRAVRSSMGTVFKLPVIETANLLEELKQLRKQGIRIMAAHPHEQRAVYQADFRQSCCIVFGSEGQGISSPVLAACDDVVAIPMSENVDSLNVGSAAAVFLFEANRQRRNC